MDKSFIEQVKESNRLEDVIFELTGIKLRKDKKTQAISCPLFPERHKHKDKHPSLIVYIESQRWQCPVCGEKGDVIDFVRLKNGWSPQVAISWLAKKANIKQKEVRDKGKKQRIREVATYPYTDEKGSLLYEVVRFEPKTFKVRRGFDDRGKPIWGLGDSRKVIYNLPEVVRKDTVIVVEGEKDAENFKKLGLLIAPTTCPFGAGKWLPQYSEFLKGKKVFCWGDNDNPGVMGMRKVAEQLLGVAREVLIIQSPEGFKDLTEFVDSIRDEDEKIEKVGKLLLDARPYTKIDTSKFKPLSSEKLVEILGLTIKKDEENKVITFYCALLAYTEDSQFNISFTAPSSTGKSYIPTEIAHLFPEADVIEIGYCSPTAFFHDVGTYEEERRGYVVDLSHKTLIFLDQPHTQLVQRLRPLLSHDRKEINLKITDKTQKFGLRTKNILLRGYPVVIFCTTGLQIDEQEATRFILLSPEIDQEKIRAGIYEKIKKETDTKTYKAELDANPERELLKERILAIKQENIQEIKIDSPEKIRKKFFEKNKILKPRHQRDIGRIISIVKAHALLNLWWRKREGSTIIANETDIEEAFKIWDKISIPQELNLSPYIYELYQEVFLAAWHEKNSETKGGVIIESLGLTRRDITKKHFQIYGRALADWKLRQEIIPMLEGAGLITQESDPNDRRKMLIYPTVPLTISQETKNANLPHRTTHYFSGSRDGTRNK